MYANSPMILTIQDIGDRRGTVIDHGSIHRGGPKDRRVAGLLWPLRHISGYLQFLYDDRFTLFGYSKPGKLGTGPATRAVLS